MGIEARGGKNAYVCTVTVNRVKGNVVTTLVSMITDVADSDEEAEGRAMRIARKAYPSEYGWRDHFVSVKSLAGIDWIGRFNMETIVEHQ